MSLHADLRPEAVARLAAQRRNSTISSLVIAVLVLVIFGLLLGFVLLPALEKHETTFVTYQANVRVETEAREKKIVTDVRRKPSSPSSSMARVITAATASPVSIPVPEVEVSAVSMDFGDGEAFGGGWGDGDGTGAGGGASFFQQEVKAERVAYVIDYSGSMRGRREKLMRAELSKSVSGLAPGMKYQMIFFCGPAWVAGGTVTMDDAHKFAEITDGGHTYRWESRGGPAGWKPKGRSQKPDWITAGPAAIGRSLSTIAGTPLAWGTQWETALSLALDLNPAPQVIFFMTDGATGGDLEEIVRRVTNRAKTRDITINTIAMMQPEAHDAMKDMAKRSGGRFTIIEKDGSVREVPLE